MPVYRRTPEDFEVEEVLAYEPSGVGDHTYVLVEKRERTSEQVARELARAASCRASEVGYAGRKDRYAVARQWFSAPGLPVPGAEQLELEGARVLAVHRHPHRLRTGKLRANRFRLVVRDVETGSIPQLEGRLAALARWGFVNRYGDQRFGRAGDNAERGLELLQGKARQRDRRAARFLVSSVQSAVFNRLVARRGALFDGAPVGLDSAGSRPVDRLLAGDLAVKEASGGVFEVLDVGAEQVRADAGEISPTGLLFGRKARLAKGAAGELESSVLAEWRLEQAPRLPGLRFDGARRSLRARPVDLEGRFAVDVLTLRFELGSGCYASVLLEELFEGLGLEEADHPPRAGGSPTGC